MGRKQTYFCDGCKREFGDETHLNIKKLKASVSNRSTRESSLGDWESTPLPVREQEYQFCNLDCFVTWFKKLVKDYEEHEPPIDKRRQNA